MMYTKVISRSFRNIPSYLVSISKDEFYENVRDIAKFWVPLAAGMARSAASFARLVLFPSLEADLPYFMGKI